jgi:hypothetical protein
VCKTWNIATNFVVHAILIVSAFSTETLLANQKTLLYNDISKSDLTVITSDDVRIKGNLYNNNNQDVIIYCHPLLGPINPTDLNLLLEAFIDKYDIITFDFRGHKKSTFVSSIGGDEILDLRAMISFAVHQGYTRIHTLGAGMGGSIAIRTAGIFGNVNTVIAISPSDIAPNEDRGALKITTDILLRTNYGKVPIRLLTNTRLGTRYSAGYPKNLINNISTIPILIVQSESDKEKGLFDIISSVDLNTGPRNLLMTPIDNRGNKIINLETFLDIKKWLRSTSASASENNTKQINLPDFAIDHYQIVISGDVPIPEKIIRTAYESRINSGLSISNNKSPSTDKILETIKNVFSYYGYNHSTFVMSIPETEIPEIVVKTPKTHSVSIQGNKWVTTEHIESVLKVGEGYYNSFEIDAAIRRLSAEPAILSVSSHFTKREDGDFDLIIKVQEKRSYRPSISTKFTDSDQFYGFGVTWNERNPSGIQMAGEVLVGAFHGDWLSNFRMGKNIFGNNIRVEGLLFKDIQSRDDLDFVYSRQEDHELGAEIFTRYKIASSTAVYLGLFGKEYKALKTRADFIVEPGKSFGNFIKLDIHGQLPLEAAPRFVWRHTIYYQRSGLGGNGDFDFHTYQLNFTGELDLGDNHKSKTTLHRGWITGNAPPQEHFSLGGMTTLPAHPDDALVNTKMVRGSQTLTISTSKWIPETSSLSDLELVFSLNAGTVWADKIKNSELGLITDVGFEFNYMKVLRLGIAGQIGANQNTTRIYIGWGTHVL